MNKRKFLPALLGGILGGTTVMVILGLLNLDEIAGSPLKRSLFLPHLFFADIVHDATMQDRHLEFVVPMLLAAQAVVVLVAIFVAGIAPARARDADWGPCLSFGLGGVGFYVAHFTFLHPAAPLAAAATGVRILDYVAVAALALGVWNLLRFFFVFPKAFDAAEFGAFVDRQFEKQHAAAAASKFALRRWLNRGTDARSRERFARLRHRALAFAQSVWFPATIAAVGWLVLALAPFVSRWGAKGFIPLALFGYLVLLMVLVGFASGASVLDWHRHEGGSNARRCAAAIWWSVNVATWVFFALFLGGMLAVVLSGNTLVLGLSFLLVPAGALVVALVFVVALAIVTWRQIEAPLASAARPT